jgi:hypothetical protein
LSYQAEITGAEDSDLAALEVSELKALEYKPPASEEAPGGRADRDLGRLADAAHSLGYWDADFYEVGPTIAYPSGWRISEPYRSPQPDNRALLCVRRGDGARFVPYLSSQTSSMRQPLYMLLVIRVSPFTQGSQQEAPAG